MNRIPTQIILVATLAVALLCPAGPSEAAVDDKGMLDLYELDSLTVVYPSSPASRKESNRISARNRGAFLAATTGVTVRVLSDAQVSARDLEDNLLLLGWDNGLLKKHGQVAPYGRSSASVRFLDHVRQDPDLDLMFGCRSPFSTDEQPRHLFFWSRIDQDQDRFMTLPMIGSDWAIYQDYLVVAQGMLENPDAWPPARDPIAEKLTDPDIAAYTRDRVSIEGGPLQVIFNPNRVDRGTASQVLEIRLNAYRQVIAMLGNPGTEFRMAIFLYADAETKERMTGVKAGAHSVPPAGEMHMTVRFARSASIHEDVHPVADRLLGSTASTAAYEGLAYALEPVLLDRPLTYHAALMLDGDQLPAITDLLDEERFRKIPNSRRFAAAGLMMKWLREQLEPGKFKTWYSSPDPAPEALASALGTTPARMEKRFREWIREQTAAHAGDVAFSAAVGQARTHHLNGEYEQAATALTQALTHKPDDLQTRYTLATTRMRTGGFDAAVRDFQKVLEKKAGSSDALTAHTMLQLGRVYDLLGRRDDALEMYRQVLTLPDRHETHLSAEEGLATPYTADRLD